MGETDRWSSKGRADDIFHRRDADDRSRIDALFFAVPDGNDVVAERALFAQRRTRKGFEDSLKDQGRIDVCNHVSAHFLRSNDLRVLISQTAFCVKSLAVHLGLDVRTLERRFGEQFRTTPKAWIMRERMSFAAPPLADGLSNKEVAASLSYTCEPNLCRDFKRYLAARHRNSRVSRGSAPLMSHFDKRAELPCPSSNSKESRLRCKAKESAGSELDHKQFSLNRAAPKKQFPLLVPKQ